MTELIRNFSRGVWMENPLFAHTRDFCWDDGALWLGLDLEQYKGCPLPDIITARRINTDDPDTRYHVEWPGPDDPITWDMMEPFFEDVHEANPEWFDAMRMAADVIVSRRYKYSAEDPYSNFIAIAEYLSQRWKQEVTVLQVFDMLHALKFSRWVNGSGDYDDETEIDNLLDDINYKLLEVGYRLRLGQTKDK